jgi:hypothetical protein
MTEDITALITELRDETQAMLASRERAGIAYRSRQVSADTLLTIADALEAQAQRITELSTAVSQTIRLAKDRADEREALAIQITEALQLFARLEERAGGWPQEVCEAHATLSAPASDVLAAHDRRVRAEALRWAAHNMPAAGCGAHSIYPWLRAEADRIEHTNP